MPGLGFYRDHGISGAKGRDRRPAFDTLCRDAAEGSSMLSVIFCAPVVLTFAM